jgi:von Willebrand factor type A domain
MSDRIADSATHRLIALPPGGPLHGNAVAVPAAAGTVTAFPCLMTIRHGPDVIRTAVHGIPLPEMPGTFIAVPEDLAAEWDADLERAQWTLDRADTVLVRALTLELPVERDLAEAAKDAAQAELAGELLWIPADGSEMSLAVGDVPHRVRSIETAGRTGVIGRITQETQVDVYASAVRAGVDIVILADCSGSMQLDDLPAKAGRRSGAARGQRWMTRMEALQQSLGDLLSVRLQMSGRVSRLALVQFNHRTRQLFPPGGGMAQLDGSSPRHDVEEFRKSVKELRPSGQTDIGNALYEAANLLHQHGHAGNEKLIVLVSDGADWTEKGEDGSGEMVEAVSEPVSLMTHLNAEVGIRLHALGISNPELYRRRGYKTAEGMVPDHQLLRELVKAGGGDPSAIGGLDVLEKYFSGLGTGVTYTVREPLAERPVSGQLPAPTITALRRLAQEAADGNWTARCAELSVAIMDWAGECRLHGLRALGDPIWEETRVNRLCEKDLPQPASRAPALARLLEQTIHTLRLRSADARLATAASVLCQTLDRLGAVAEQQATLADTYHRYFGVRASVMSALQADAMKRVCAGMAALYENLRNLPDYAGRADPPSAADGPTVYRD